MISRTMLSIAVLLTVSPASYGKTLELTRDEPFTGEKIFCVEVTGASVKDDYPLIFTLSLADKDVPIRYFFNGRLMKEFTADHEFKGRQKVPGPGKYAFTFVTAAKTTIKKFEIQDESADSRAKLDRCT